MLSSISFHNSHLLLYTCSYCICILEGRSWLYQVVTHGDKAGFEVFSIHDPCSLLQGQRWTNQTRRRREI